MTNATAPDLGPLTWVKGEIDAALARADEGLQDAGSGTSALQFAQTHLHQVRGALSIVGLDGLTQFADTLEQLLGDMIRGEQPADPAHRALARRALAVIGNYLEEIAHGAPDQALRLAPHYLALGAARGLSDAGPVDLFHPDLSRRPSLRTPARTPTEDLATSLRAARSRFERGLLEWLRKGPASDGARAMREAMAEVEALQRATPTHTLWWVSLGFFDTLIHDDSTPDPALKRLCAQVDAQFRRLLAGTPSAPDRLVRELLYRIATSPTHTPQQAEVKACWQLDGLIPEPGAAVSETPIAPLLERLNRQLAQAREHWDAFCSGTAVALAQFDDALEALSLAARPLERPVALRLLDAMLGFARWLRRDPLQFTDAGALELATDLLMLETAFERRPPDADLARRVNIALARLASLQRGETLPEDGGALDLGSAAQSQEKAALAQVAKEMLASLALVEQALDDFFRNQAKCEPLQHLHKPLQQIIGALSMLGETDALRLVRDASTRIAGLAHAESSDSPGEFEALAHTLSALGFYIEALPRGNVRLDDLLNPHATQEQPASVQAAGYAAAELAPAGVCTEAEAEPAPASEACASVVDTAIATPGPTAPPAPTAPTQATDERSEPEALLPQERDDDEITLIEDLEDAAALEFDIAPPLLAPLEIPTATPAVPVASSASQIDAELLAIFIEEAVEVLATVREHLELLRTEPSAGEHLITIRRGFHTLKGSGRMVGLSALGEVAWAVEQTLNRWLQLDWPVTPALLHFVDDGQQLFDSWVSSLQAGSGSIPDAQALTAEAERLRAAEEPPLAPPLAPESAPEWSPEAATDTRIEADAGVTALDFPTLELGDEGEILPLPALGDETVAVEPAPAAETGVTIEAADYLLDGDIGDIGIMPSTAEADQLDAEEAVEDLGTPAAAAAEAPSAAQPSAETSAAAESIELDGQSISRALHELYCMEAAQHLDALEIEFERLRLEGSGGPTLAAQRAAHTYAGISGTARLTAPHQLGRALEHALGRLRDGGRSPDASELEVLDASLAALRQMLDDVCALQAPEPQQALICALDAGFPAQPPALPAEHEDVIASPTDNQAGAGVEPIAQVEHEDVGHDVQPSAAAGGAAPASPAAGRTAAPEDEAAQHDDVDTQLLPIFLEEAAELLTELHATLRSWRNEPASEEHPRAVARVLHSLKGSARMTGAMKLGARLHALESRLEDGVAAREAAASLADELALGLDTCEQLIDNLALPGAPAAAATESAPVPEAAAGVATDADARPISTVAEGGEGETIATPTLRVRAELIDRFVNQAGEIGVARSRIDGELRTLRRSLLDLTENVIRLRNQLREVEIQAEVQMQSRIAQAESQHGEFDPLELDRYTRLQELTRMMAESVNDVTTVQQNLLHNLDGADIALNGQARLSRDLQQGLMQVRMLPFDSLASRLYQVVRQSARELGKRATLDLRGGRIELDRSVLEQVAAPLEHLLRNAVAHGIETPAARRAAGKAETGRIDLKVTQEGNEVAIEIADDGAGLDFERIAQRARERGLIGPGEHPDDKRLTNLIFVSGFSTASELSAVSGRGVGMDVVKAQTAAAGGRVDVSSRRGEGTRFHIHLPLTLAVTQALLVRASARTWAIPSNMVVQAMELKPDALRKVQDERGLNWQGEHFAYRYLPRLLGDHDARPEAQRHTWVLLLRAGAQTLALHVDGLRGNQEIIVKNAGPQLTRIIGMSGASVLGNGEVVLILNPVALASRGLTDEDGDAPGTIEPPPPPLHLPTVMVVDDSLTVRKITGRLLEREGYRVLTAKDGVDALEQLIDTRPDVVLSDIEMPRMDGFDLLRNIRADERLQHLPVIMITSRLAEKHRRYAQEIGANHYLGKPYQEEELLALVAGYCGRVAG